MKRATAADPEPDRQSTIYDVAQFARVSVPTVSRVLTGAARVSPELTDRVLDAIETLNFRPNETARALVRRKPNVIAVITSNTARYGYSSTIGGIEQSARAAGYAVTISVIDDADSAQDAIDSALRLPLAGVLVLKFDSVGVAVLNDLPTYLPIVVVSGEMDGRYPQAALDEEAGGRAITQHQLDLGHRTVHHVTIPPSRGEDARTTGWRKALEAAGAHVPALIAGTWDAKSGVEIGAELAHRRDVTAVFCGNDELAMGVVAGITDSGRRVPEDISIVGFDDHPLSGIWRPAITTVAQDFGDLGQRAVKLLLAQIAGDKKPTLSLALPTLTIRSSSGPPSATPRMEGAADSAT